jgi:hypothetical protein
VELAARPPAGLVPDIAEPRVYGVGELVRLYLRARRQRRPVVPVPRPGGAAARALRRAPTWRRTGPWAGGAGRSSWPSA